MGPSAHGGIGVAAGIKSRRMGTVTKTNTIAPNRALVGTWITDEEDSDTAFTISLKNNKFHGSGFCKSDGEKFTITKVKWDRKAPSFTARMPSTNWVTENVFRIRRDGKVELELTLWEVWKKKDVKPGKRPEAWE
jgi:hypothetical protein